MFLVKKTFAAILFSFITFVFFSCRDNRKEIDQMMQKQTVFPSEQGEVVEIIYTDSGRVQMRLTAPIMNHYTYNVPEPYTEMPKGVFVEFFNDSGKVKTTLKANYALRYEKSKRTEAKKNVVVVNVSGEILNTEQLYWDEATRKIYTDVPVIITTKKDILKGTGMESNQDFTDYTIRNVSGKSNAPGEEEEKK